MTLKGSNVNKKSISINLGLRRSPTLILRENRFIIKYRFNLCHHFIS
jgi:hypothetical protein